MMQLKRMTMRLFSYKNVEIHNMLLNYSELVSLWYDDASDLKVVATHVSSPFYKPDIVLRALPMCF